MSKDKIQEEMINRRHFIGRLAKAGISIGVAGGMAAWLYDAKGPEGRVDKEETVTLPDYSVKLDKPLMAVARGADRIKTIGQALDAIGGIETFIKSGDRVLLKVNAAFATPAALGATSHPDLVGELIRLCLKAGAAQVCVSDNPINDPASCFKLTGIAEATEKAGGKLIPPTDKYFAPFTLKGGKLITRWPILYAPLKGITKVIGVAPLKDHHRSGASMTMKNWYGLLGGRRNIFHQDIHNTIMELAMMVKPTLVVLDATIAMMTNGPTGGSLADLKATNTMIVSMDQVAADAYGCTLLGRPLSALPYLAKTMEAGVGTTDFDSLKPQASAKRDSFYNTQGMMHT